MLYKVVKDVETSNGMIIKAGSVVQSERGMCLNYYAAIGDNSLKHYEAIFYNYIAQEYQIFDDWVETEEEFIDNMVKYMVSCCGDKYNAENIDSIYEL